MTLQSSCCVLFNGQAAAVNQWNVYSQSSVTEIKEGRESWDRKAPVSLLNQQDVQYDINNANFVLTAPGHSMILNQL